MAGTTCSTSWCKYIIDKLAFCSLFTLLHHQCSSSIFYSFFFLLSSNFCQPHKFSLCWSYISLLQSQWEWEISSWLNRARAILLSSGASQNDIKEKGRQFFFFFKFSPPLSLSRSLSVSLSHKDTIKFLRLRLCQRHLIRTVTVVGSFIAHVEGLKVDHTSSVACKHVNALRGFWHPDVNRRNNIYCIYAFRGMC